MAILNILEYPDPRLRKIAAAVAAVTPEIRKLVADMAETMYAAPGVGLAATQVDVHKRIIVMDVSEARDELRVFINPEIVSAEGDAECEEGCLSVADFCADVRRHAQVLVKGLDREGKPVEITGEGLLAVVLQHEIDHLNGILFIDHISRLKRGLFLRRLKKQAVR